NQQVQEDGADQTQQNQIPIEFDHIPPLPDRASAYGPNADAQFVANIQANIDAQASAGDKKGQVKKTADVTPQQKPAASQQLTAQQQGGAKPDSAKKGLQRKDIKKVTASGSSKDGSGQSQGGFDEIELEKDIYDGTTTPFFTNYYGTLREQVPGSVGVSAGSNSDDGQLSKLPLNYDSSDLTPFAATSYSVLKKLNISPLIGKNALSDYLFQLQTGGVTSAAQQIYQTIINSHTQISKLVSFLKNYSQYSLSEGLIACISLLIDDICLRTLPPAQIDPYTHTFVETFTPTFVQTNSQSGLFYDLFNQIPLPNDVVALAFRSLQLRAWLAALDCSLDDVTHISAAGIAMFTAQQQRSGVQVAKNLARQFAKSRERARRQNATDNKILKDQDSNSNASDREIIKAGNKQTNLNQNNDKQIEQLTRTDDMLDKMECEVSVVMAEIIACYPHLQQKKIIDQEDDGLNQKYKPQLSQLVKSLLLSTFPHIITNNGGKQDKNSASAATSTQSAWQASESFEHYRPNLFDFLQLRSFIIEAKMNALKFNDAALMASKLLDEARKSNCTRWKIPALLVHSRIIRSQPAQLPASTSTMQLSPSAVQSLGAMQALALSLKPLTLAVKMARSQQSPPLSEIDKAGVILFAAETLFGGVPEVFAAPPSSFNNQSFDTLRKSVEVLVGALFSPKLTYTFVDINQSNSSISAQIALEQQQSSIFTSKDQPPQYPFEQTPSLYLLAHRASSIAFNLFNSSLLQRGLSISPLSPTFTPLISPTGAIPTSSTTSTVQQATSLSAISVHNELNNQIMDTLKAISQRLVPLIPANVITGNNNEQDQIQKRGSVEFKLRRLQGDTNSVTSLSLFLPLAAPADTLLLPYSNIYITQSTLLLRAAYIRSVSSPHETFNLTQTASPNISQTVTRPIGNSNSSQTAAASVIQASTALQTLVQKQPGGSQSGNLSILLQIGTSPSSVMLVIQLSASFNLNFVPSPRICIQSWLECARLIIRSILPLDIVVFPELGGVVTLTNEYQNQQQQQVQQTGDKEKGLRENSPMKGGRQGLNTGNTDAEKSVQFIHQDNKGDISNSGAALQSQRLGSRDKDVSAGYTLGKQKEKKKKFPVSAIFRSPHHKYPLSWFLDADSSNQTEQQSIGQSSNTDNKQQQQQSSSQQQTNPSSDQRDSKRNPLIPLNSVIRSLLLWAASFLGRAAWMSLSSAGGFEDLAILRSVVMET
ncbi:MAG: hypothetical protein EZS28_029378, partial [Streblomastix strix]